MKKTLVPLLVKHPGGCDRGIRRSVSRVVLAHLDLSHEGNYSMANILSAVRTEERATKAQ
jgi:hypothetical protein